jgi:hypothetical protein
MDYPQIEFLLGLGLALSVSLSLGLSALLGGRQDSPLVLGLLALLVAPSLLPPMYIVYQILVYRTPAFGYALLFSFACIAVLVVLGVAWLGRRSLSPSGRIVAWLVLVASVAANLGLSYLLYRSLVPVP